MGTNAQATILGKAKRSDFKDLREPLYHHNELHTYHQEMESLGSKGTEKSASVIAKKSMY